MFSDLEENCKNLDQTIQKYYCVLCDTYESPTQGFKVRDQIVVLTEQIRSFGVNRELQLHGVNKPLKFFFRFKIQFIVAIHAMKQ